MNLEQQIEHYKAVRNRIMNAKRASLVMKKDPDPADVYVAPKPPKKRREHNVKVTKQTQESIAYILDAYGVTWNEVIGPVRETKYTTPRRAIWWLLRCKGLSIAHIGSITNRDHTTVMHGLRKVNSWDRS
jgi:chromosomal replication initiation ATPase DnaA